MNKEIKVKAVKFGVKLVLKYLGADLLGDAVGLVAGVGEEALPEATKNMLEAFSDTSADFFADEGGDVAKSYLTKGERYVNFHLARGICKVWEDALTESLPKNRAANSKYFLLPQDSFQDFNEQVEFFIEKFKQAQEIGNEHLLTELFYDKDRSEEGFYKTFFAGVQNETSAEVAYWQTLENALRSWSIVEDKFRYEWKNGFPEDFEKELKKFLFGNLRFGLKEIFDKNEQFRNAFQFSADLLTFDHINKLPAEIKDQIENAQSENRFYYSQLQERFSGVEMKIETLVQAIQKAFDTALSPELIEKIEETHFIGKELYKLFKLYYFSEVDYSSKTLKQAVLAYLMKIADKAIEPNKIYPEEFRTKEKKTIFFNNITQRVQVVKKEQFDIYKAKLDEKARIDGTFREEIDKKIYDQRGFEAEMFQRETQERVEIYEWNDETRKDFKRNVILGDPGLGKSSLLNFEANKLANEAIQILQNAKDTPEETAKVLRNIKIPINLRIADIAGEATKSKELVLTIAELASFDEKVNDERKSLELYLKETICKQQNAVLLFDALDEVPEGTEKGLTRREIADKISNFAKEYQENSILLTSRKVNYERVNLHSAKQNSLSDDNLEILPFDETQIKNYVAGWFGKDSQTTESFLNLLENQTQTAGLSQNPLMLFLMCRVFYDKQREYTIEEAEKHFPNNRCEIYEQCMQGLLKDWKDGKSKKTIKPANLQSEIRKLERTAFNLFFKGYEQFSETDFQTAFCGIENINLISDDDDEKSRKFLEECKADGIITETTSGKNPQFRFIHLTFQEYLTASHLAKQLDWKHFIFEKHRKGLQNKILFNRNWQHTLQLLGGKLSAGEAKDFIETLLQLNGENGEGDILFRPFILANFVAKEASNKLAEDYKIELMEKTIDKYHNPPNFQFFNIFLLPLQNWGIELINYFLPHLNNESKDEEVRNKNELIVSLLPSLNSSKRKIITKFIELIIAEKNDEYFQRNLSFALSRIKNIPAEFSEQILELFIAEIDNRNVNFSLQNALSHIKDNSSKFLNQLFGASITTSYNQNVSRSLVLAFCNTEVIPADFFEPILEIINAEDGNYYFIPYPLYTKKKYHAIRYPLAFALTHIKDIPADSIKPLLQLIIDEKDSRDVRTCLIEALSNIKDIPVEFYQHIFQLLAADANKQTASYYLVKAICNIRDIPGDFFKQLLQLFITEKDNQDFRSNFPEAFSNIKDMPNSFIEEILQLISAEEKNQPFRSSLAKALSYIKDIPTEFFAPIFQLIIDEKVNQSFRSSLAKALTNIQGIPYEFFAPICELITAEKWNNDFRALLAKTLGNIKDISTEFIIKTFQLYINEKYSLDVESSLVETLNIKIVEALSDKPSISILNQIFVMFRDYLVNIEYENNSGKTLHLRTISLITKKFMIAVPLEGEIDLAGYAE